MTNGDLYAIGGNTYVGVFDANFFNNGNNEVYINNYFSDGTLKWSKNYGYQPWNNIHLGYDITETSDGGFAYTGFSNNDIWLVKTDSLGNFTTSISEYLYSISSVNIFPNPSNGKIKIQSAKNISSVSIYDSHGRISYYSNTGIDKFYETDLQYLVPDLYLINIIFRDGSVYSTKLIKQ